MDNIEEKIAVYNEHIDFVIKFTAPGINEIYKSFKVEEKLHRALTFNYKNSIIKADGEIIEGDFNYDYKENILVIEFENPAVKRNMDIEIKIAANITNLAAIIESNYIISNVAYLKIKGYEDINELITKSNVININFTSVKLDISTDSVNQIIPAINGEKIICHALFNTLDTDADYDIVVKNILCDGLAFESSESNILMDGEQIENPEIFTEGNEVNISFHNSCEIKNKRIDIHICSKIQNVQNITDKLFNEFKLFINNKECSSSIIEIPIIKPISDLTNIFLYDK